MPWADLAITVGCLLLTRWVLHADDLAVTLPMVWIAGPVIAWAIRAGRRADCAAAAVIGACCMVVRGRIDLTGVNEGVLLLLTAIAIGHIARLSSEAETRALEVATARERERLARGIHDSVLQVLALVQRRGTELVATPAAAVVLPGAVADELAAAVGAALDNVRRHVGPHAPAWLLVEDEGDGVVVTVRDDGPASRQAGWPTRRGQDASV